MSGPRADFLATAAGAVALLREPAVAASWDRESALPEFTVRGLAGHIAYQVLAVPALLAGPVPAEPVVSVFEHYARVPWIDAGRDHEFNVGIRRQGEEVAAAGPAELAAALEAAVAQLSDTLPAGGNRAVRLPIWGSWSLTLDDLLVTRVIELAVHGDDLAVSVGVATPTLTPGATDTVVRVLTRLAVRRHGATAVIRALSRRERAPETISAF